MKEEARLDGLQEYAKFIATDKSIDIETASRLASFLLITKDCKFVIAPKIWVRDDIARVYFEAWSQNKRHALDDLDKIYFDAESTDVVVQKCACGFLTKECLKERGTKFKRFSGAKTREAFHEFLDVMTCLRNYWE